MEINIGGSSIKTSIVHIFVYGILIRHSKEDVIDRNFLIGWVRRILRLMNESNRWIFIKEMEQAGLIEKITTKKYRLLNKKIKTIPKDYYGNPLW